MKKTVSLLLCVILTFSICIPVCASGAEQVESSVANLTTQPTQEIISAVSKALYAMETEKSVYGFDSIDFAALKLGNRIPAYELKAGNAILLDYEYYPIFENNKLICFAVVTQIEGDTLAFISAELVEKIPTDLLHNSIALLYDSFGVYVLQDGTISLLGTSDLEITGRDHISDIAPASLASLETALLSGSVPLPASTLPFGDEDDVSIYLSVPIKRQEEESEECWAACMASMIQYLTGASYSAQQISDMYHYTSGGVDTAVVGNYLESDFGLPYYSSYRVNSTTKSNIYNSLYHDSPVYGAFSWTYNGDSSYHAVVIRGINLGTMTFSVMDPEDTNVSYRAGNFTSSGKFTVYNNWGGILMTLASYLYYPSRR